MSHIVNTAITTLQLGLVFQQLIEAVICATPDFPLTTASQAPPGTVGVTNGGAGVWPSVTKGWMGVQFMVKKRNVPLE